MYPMMNIATRGVRKAGNLIVKLFETPHNFKANQTTNKFITNVYKAAEATIVETIRKFYPQHTIIANNTYAYQCKNIDPNIHWIIDSLSGVTNFIKNLPYFTISIAIRIKNRTEVAVIYDPIHNELFTAIRGKGAKMNNYRLRGNNVRSLHDTILAIGFPQNEQKKYVLTYINILAKLLYKCADFRCIGSSALNLAYVAAGRVDGYFEIGLKPRDFTAGELIARESGIVVCDFNGNHNYTVNGNIIAGNPKIVQSILMNMHHKMNHF